MAQGAVPEPGGRRGSQYRSQYRQLWPLLLVLLAFVLRVYHLDFQSLWSDEGISLLRSSQPLGQMLRLMPVEHVPGYFVLLNFWLPLAGTGDFALRFPSLIPSVLVVALAYRLAVDLGARRAGLIAGMLLATSAFQVWYAQEARMYSWLLATALASTWFLWHLLPARKVTSRRTSDANMPGAVTRQAGRAGFIVSFAGYVLTTAASIYLHHYGFLLPVAQTVFMLLWLATTRDLRGFGRWVLAGLAVVALYLPWLPRFLGIFGFPGWRQALDPANLPWRYLAAYTVGDAMPAPWHDWLPWVYLALALAGLWIWWRQDRLAGLLLLCVTALPYAGAFALALRQPDYHERYTIFISAPLVLLAARGLEILDFRYWRQLAARRQAAGPGPQDAETRHRSRAGLILPGLALAALLAANAVALYRLYGDPAVQKADYKAAVRQIEQAGQPGDVILLDGPEPQQIFLHYYQGQLPWRDLRVLDNTGDAQADAGMLAATGGERRAWVLRQYHEEGPVQAWLARNGWQASQSYYGGLYFSLYGLPGLARARLPGSRPFGPALTLTHVELMGAEQAGDEPTVQAGDLLGLTTDWQVLGKVPPLKFSLRLQDAAGVRYAAEDYVPQAGFAPTESWVPGTTVGDRHALWLPADLPPGRYQVALVLYDPATGQALDTGQTPVLVTVRVLPAERPPDPAGLPIPVRVGRPINEELMLLGYGVAPQKLRPGQGASLTVWWQALAAPAEPYQLLVELTDGRGQFAARKLYPLDRAPADTWLPGQVLRAAYRLELNPAVSSGNYRVDLTLAGPNGQPLGPPLALGRVAVETRSRNYSLPRSTNPLEASLGRAIVLRAYDLGLPRSAPGDLKVTLYWGTNGPAGGSYKVFVHLIDDGGQIVTQSDALPGGGNAPTESWLAGEVIADAYKLAVPAPGRYRLLTGLYDPASGQRLPAREANGLPLPGDAVQVAEFQIP